MCTHSKMIKSPEKAYRPLTGRAYLQVPDGKCEECRNQQKQEWFLRLWSEIKHYNSIGGKCVFVTNTYRPSCRPYFDYTDLETGEIFHIPGFYKHDKDQFFNTIIQWFKRKGLTAETTESKLGLRFICASEYAPDPRFGHQPHYHTVMLFPPEYVDKLNFQTENQWKRFIEKRWKYGFCLWSKKEKGGIFVKSDFAARYVSKYMCKDMDWYNQPEVMNFLCPDGDKIDPVRRNMMKDYLPKHWQSKSFGLKLTELCKDNAVFKDGLSMDFVSDRLSGKDKKYPVPRYIRRKLLYDYDKNTGRFYLNSRGIAYNRDYVSELLIDSEERLTKYISIDYLCQQSIQSDFYHQFNDAFKDWNKKKVFGEDSLRKHLVSLLDGLTVRHAVYYNKFIRGRICKKEDYMKYGDLLLRLGEPRSDTWFQDCLELYDIQLEQPPNVVEYSEGFMNYIENPQKELYFLDNFLDFQKLNIFLQQIEYLKHYLSERRNQVYRDKWFLNKLVKSMVS